MLGQLHPPEWQVAKRRPPSARRDKFLSDRSPGWSGATQRIRTSPRLLGRP